MKLVERWDGVPAINTIVKKQVTWSCLSKSHR